MAFTERSARTRADILAAAQRRFAKDGYDRATIRSIAADAGIDPSMVIRYFGSKADLYTAASAIDLAVPRLESVAEAEIARQYVEAMLARWESGENTAEAVLLRTAPTHPDAAARVQDIFTQQVVPALRQALPHLDQAEVEKRAALLLSQTLGVVYCRYLLALEPLASMDVEEVTRSVTRAVEAHLAHV